ncbi:MAG: PQQ-binding-like beta-propeller repeat protein [Gemmataceae bacterium]|nr:PQQ-binding-like beta-propeller repeat protein [Gemmataceae bacterium]
MTCLLLLALCADWPHFRGPGMQGHSDDARVPLEWSEAKNVLWSLDLPGDGHSSPIVVAGRVFLTGSDAKGTSFCVFCVDAKSGKLLWKETAAKDQEAEKTHVWHGHASPSCASDGKHVWAFFGTPGVFCCTVEGKPVWKKKFGVFTSKAGWGVAASPFLHGDNVLVNCDNDGGPGAAPAALVALDKLTGKQAWATPRDQGRGFSTPVLMKTAGGREDLVLNGPEGLWGYDPKTGKERWRCTRSDDGGEEYKFGEPLPAWDAKGLFVLSGRRGPWQVVALPGEGDVTAKNVLHSRRRDRRDVASPLLLDGLAYCVDKGSVLTVFDTKTGKETASVPLAGRKGSDAMASPVYVRGKILCLLAEGTTVVVEPGAKPKVAGRNKLPGDKLDFGASPAIADGRLYLRSRTKLWCIGEKR